MPGALNENHGREIGRLAVVVGTCGYSSALVSKVAQLGVAHELFSWVRHVEGRRYLNPFELVECIKIFQEEGITHVINAGAVDSRLLLTHRPWLEFFDIPKTMKITRPRQFYLEYDAGLRGAGITAMSAGDFFDSYRPIVGAMGRIQLHPSDEAILPDLKQQTMHYCSGESMFARIAQAVVFENGHCLAVETSGTDKLLRSLQAKAKAQGARRIVVKLLPDGFPPKLDSPTIGPHTILEAKRANIDVIAFDAMHGQIIDRDETTSQADAYNIALVGI